MPNNAILCVDDEEIILKCLGDQLRRHFGDQYIYEFAESADEALEVIDDLNKDDVSIILIVSDWLMPGMKGDEFLIRVHRKFPGIVKVMLTGHADIQAIERARKDADLHRCISKPWTEEELIEAMTSGWDKNS
jgi:CheY-like chemotaxis protein